jgi:S1-C subfamily serine protease
MYKLFICFIALFSFGFSQGIIHSSVVKIYTTGETYDYTVPWGAPQHFSASGSGCIIESNRILTNAHVVEGAIYVEVKKANDPKLYIGKVVHVNNAYDLALVEIEDLDFFQGTTTLQFGELPQLQDPILACGYPTGGSEITVTRGEISRIEYIEYVHSKIDNLACQISAPINPGNSGGPILSPDGAILGIAMQGAPKLQNTGYMIPVTLIDQFLEEVDHKLEKTIMELGITVQSMDNQSLQKFFGLSKGITGILIKRVNPSSCLYTHIHPGDILIEINGHQIFNDGSVRFRENEFLPLDHHVRLKRIGDQIQVKVLRSGKEIDLNLQLSSDLSEKRLMPYTLDSTPPSYYVYAGFVFQKLDNAYCKGYFPDSFVLKMVHFLKFCFKYQTEDQKEVVLLSKVLPHQFTNGYTGECHEMVTRVNGKPIGSLKEIILAIETNTNSFHVIETKSGAQFIIDRVLAEKAHTEILHKFHIHSDRSKNLMN